MEKMRLFSVGPVNMFDYSLEISARQVPYFRTDEFSQVVFGINQNMKTLLDADKSAKIALLTASGTGAMEAVVQTLNKDKKVLIINGGSFGDRFQKLAENHNVPYDVINLKFAQDLTKEILQSYENECYQALLVNIHETSIGKYYSPTLLKDFCNKNGCFLIIDAISSFLTDEFSMKDFNADVVIISSQKALSLYPGLSIVAVSNNYYLDNIKDKKVASSYLDIQQALKDAERGQTPFTPAINIIYQLEQRLQVIIKNGGATNEINRSKNLANFFRKEIVKLGFAIPNFCLSNCLTPIICPNNNATEIFEMCKNNYNIYLTPSGGENKEKLLRVGHLGDLKIEDYEFLLEKLAKEIK